MDIEIHGPRVIFTIPILGGIDVNETTVNAWLIIGFVFILCLILTRKLEKIPRKRTQQIAEKIVTMVDNIVLESMGQRNMKYAPYILTLLVFSAFGSLISLLGMRSITADINTTAGWALMTFFMIYYAGIKKNGLRHFHGLIEPLPFMLPLNLISEVATPISMTFRHFGNIFAGSVISILVYGALAAASYAILPALHVPFLQVGIPAVLSIYFDLFSGAIQAYVFSMLTMAYVSNANSDGDE